MIQTPNTAGTGLNLGSSSLFMNSSGSFTIACRIIRLGTGINVSTGTGGLTAIEPILTGGVGESETIGLNLPFFMGWIPASSRIGVDYEDRNNGLNWPASSSSTFSNNTQYHLAATYNTGSATWRIYVNGALDRSVTTIATSSQRVPDTASRQAVGVSCAISSSAGRSGAFNGIVSDVCIWSTVLNDAEVSLLANSKNKLTVLQIQSSSLKGFWKLDDGQHGQTYPTTVNLVRDISGNNRHGTAFGTITSRGDFISSY